MEEDKFYFIAFCWRGELKWNFTNSALKNEHPLKWLRDAVKKYPEENYIIINWKEITKEEYEIIHSWI